VSSWQTIAKVSPMDVIRSATINAVIDNLEYLKARTPAPFILGSSYDLLQLTAGGTYSLLPFHDGYSSESPSTPKGLPLPFKARLSSLVVAIRDNTLNSNVNITLYVEGTGTSLSITIPSGGTGIFANSLNEVVADSQKRVYLVVNLAPASSGAIKIEGWSIKATLEI